MKKHTPAEKKYLRSNHSNFVTKELSITIMFRSGLRNHYSENREDKSRMTYSK